MWGLFYYVFLIIVIALRGGGAIVGNRPPPLKKSAICMDAFLLPFRCLFFHVRAFLLRFSHYNFALAEGGGRARLGVCPSLKNEEKNMFCYMRGLLLLFVHVQFFATLFTMGGVFLIFFFYVGSLFCFYGGGGFFFLLAPPTKTSAFYFCE